MSTPIDLTGMPPATVVGSHARAWRLPLRASPPHAGIAHWLVVHANAHPFWTRWHLSVIHLRAVPGLTAAHRMFPEASHEFMIQTVDPSTYANHPAIIAGVPGAGFRYLTPADAIEQFSVPADHMAEQILGTGIHLICSGKLSPDSDYRGAWNSFVQFSAKDLREGKRGLG